MTTTTKADIASQIIADTLKEDGYPFLRVEDHNDGAFPRIECWDDYCTVLRRIVVCNEGEFAQAEAYARQLPPMVGEDGTVYDAILHIVEATRERLVWTEVK